MCDKTSTAALFLALIFTCSDARAQGRDPGASAFEVSSVKPNDSGDFRRAIGPGPGGRFQGLNVPLRDLVAFAYGVRAGLQVTGGNAWVDQRTFDVDALAPGGSATPDEMRAMMRALLADRFQLRVHREVREVAAYDLVMARDDRRPGPQLRPSAIDCAARRAAARRGGPTPAPAGPPPNPATVRPVCGLRQTPGRLAGDAVSMMQLASALERFVGRIVFDRTGAGGYFDVDLEWTPGPEQAPRPGGAPPAILDSSATPIFTALREQLGVRLEGSRAPLEVVVIDSAQLPTPN